MQNSILLVDDEPNVTKSLVRALRPEGYKLHVADSGQEGLEILEKHLVDIVITDQRMPGMSGSEFLNQMRLNHPEKAAVMLSGYADFDDVVTALNDGKILRFISKPWDKNVLKEVVRNTLADVEQDRLLNQNADLIDHSLDSVIIMDEQGYIIRANSSAHKLLGYKPYELEKLSIDFLRSIKTDSETLAAIFALLEEQSDWSGDLWLRKKSTDDVLVKVKLRPFLQDEEVRGYVLYFRDESEIAILEQEVHKLRTEDSTSGALTHDRFMYKLETFMSQDNHSKSMALAVLRIPKFDQLVVAVGYALAKRLILEVGRRIRNTLGNEGCAGRLAEDKFAVISGWLSNDDEIADFADKLTSIFKDAFEIDMHCIPVRPDIGVAVYPHDRTTPECLLQAAIQAADFVSQQAEMSWAYYQHCIDNVLGCKFLVEKELRRAIRENQLKVYYQPQINLRTGQVDSVEALVRWTHEEHGAVSPETFITKAEKSGLIIALDKWVMFESLTQLALWHKEDINISMSINISAIELQSDEIVERVDELLKRTGVSADKVDLEITETTLIDCSRLVLNRLARLKRLGVGIILDDFGTGYSSLTSLCELPIDGIKIDRSFLFESEKCRIKQAIIESVVTIADRMGLKVVAEGVENDTQLDLLRNFEGQIHAQSFMLGVPMSADSLATLFNDNLTIK